MPLHANEVFIVTPGGEVGQIAIGDLAVDQDLPGPYAGHVLDVFVGSEVGELELGPVM